MSRQTLIFPLEAAQAHASCCLRNCSPFQRQSTSFVSKPLLIIFPNSCLLAAGSAWPFELEDERTLARVSLGLALLFKLPPPDPASLQKTLPGRMGGTDLPYLPIWAVCWWWEWAPAICSAWNMLLGQKASQLCELPNESSSQKDLGSLQINPNVSLKATVNPKPVPGYLPQLPCPTMGVICSHGRIGKVI